MMMSALLISLVLAPQEVKTKTYEDYALGLSFKHPVTWKFKKGKNSTQILLPLGAGIDAKLELFATTFRQEPDRWQALQLQVNQNLKRTVEKQWQETLLGVPMLMTQVAFVETGQEMRTLVGLLFSATPNKFHFRLSSPAIRFEEAEKQWREALVSLRPISGELPVGDDPNKPLPATASTKPAKPPRVDRLTPDEPKRETKGKQKVACSAAGRDLVLYLPDGWRAESMSGAMRFDLTHSGLKGKLNLEILSSLDSPEPDKMLLQSAASSLAEFVSVRLREDPQPFKNEAGARIFQSRREGIGQEGELLILHAAGAKGDFYWLLTYRVSGGRQGMMKDKKLLNQLMDFAVVELAR